MSDWKDDPEFKVLLEQMGHGAASKAIWANSSINKKSYAPDPKPVPKKKGKRSK